MNSRVLGFVSAFIIIAALGFVFGPKFVNESPQDSKRPLDLEYDVNLPYNADQEIRHDEKMPIAVTPAYPVPDLDRPVVIYAQIPEETKKLAIERIAIITKTLKEDTSFFDEWIELGTYRKLIGDYNGALEIWLYASGLNPASSVVYNNIATLYSSYLRDYQKAEEYYLKAIEVAPVLPYPYFAAFEFYKSVLKDDKKAEDIIEKGTIAVPSSKTELEALLD